MDPISLIEKYYPAGSLAHRILLRHSMRVAAKAAGVTAFLQNLESVDAAFVEEAALLHDIGMLYTDAPELGCRGDLPYLAHAYKGRS